MWLDQHRDRILEFIKQGLSDTKIAEELRVSASTVRYWRDRNGIARPARAKKSDSDAGTA